MTHSPFQTKRSGASSAGPDLSSLVSWRHLRTYTSLLPQSRSPAPVCRFCVRCADARSLEAGPSPPFSEILAEASALGRLGQVHVKDISKLEG